MSARRKMALICRAASATAGCVRPSLSKTRIKICGVVPADSSAKPGVVIATRTTNNETIEVKRAVGCRIAVSWGSLRRASRTHG